MGAMRKSAYVVLAVFAAACARSHAAGPTVDAVKVEVASVGMDSESGTHFVLLADESSHRTLPIMIGDSEARAIIIELHGLKPPRPLTHDLLRTIIEQTGNRVDRVVIGDMRNETYYAAIYLDRGRYRVDSRPSDAIALALGANAPIYVASRLFETSPGGSLPPGLPRVSHGLGVTVQDLTPQIAAALGQQPRSGVLVADIEAPAGRGGVERGDVITSVGGVPVKTLKDFDESVSKLKPGDSVDVAYSREGAPQSATIKVPAQPAGD
jgi:bifunctional DNase/RNase